MFYLYLAIFGASLVLLVLTPLYCYLSNRNKKSILAVIVKGITTSISLIFSIIGYVRIKEITNTSSVPDYLYNNYWIIIGMAICLIADIAICFSIVSGGVAFFFGHVAYLVFFFSISTFHPVSILIFTLVCVAALCYFYRYSPMFEKLLIPVSIYAVLIFFSFSIGILLPFTIGIYGCLPAIAILLLVCSDVMLARNKVVEETHMTRTVALLYYFAGQFLMAMTLYLPTIKID